MKCRRRFFLALVLALPTKCSCTFRGKFARSIFSFVSAISLTCSCRLAALRGCRVRPALRRLSRSGQTRRNSAHHLPRRIYFRKTQRPHCQTLSSAEWPALRPPSHLRERRAGNIFIADFPEQRWPTAKFAGDHSQNYFSIAKRETGSGNRGLAFDTGRNGAAGNFSRRHFRNTFVG
jgi:hypothetical protein